MSERAAHGVRQALSSLGSRMYHLRVAGFIARQGIYDEIARITAPTLVIVGEEDVATVPEKARRIAGRVPGARLVTIPGAGHTATVEQPALVTAAIAAFRDSLPRG